MTIFILHKLKISNIEDLGFDANFIFFSWNSKKAVANKTYYVYHNFDLEITRQKDKEAAS